MTRQRSALSRTVQALRELALRYPEAQEGIACAGTSAERRTVTARNKAFLFLGVDNVMLKLRESLAEAASLAAEEPSRYKVGAHGWVTASLSEDGAPPLSLLEKWVDESYRLVANKQREAPSPTRKPPTATKKTARKKAARKKTASP
jgi:hypothetical protein